MPQFDSNSFGELFGRDGLFYGRDFQAPRLVVRHATFWSAIWNMGLRAALLPRRQRPLEARGWFGWEPIAADYRGITGRRAYIGPMTNDEIIAEAIIDVGKLEAA